VPLFAASKIPVLSIAPVNAPFAEPKRIPSNKLSGTDAQFTGMNGWNFQ